MLMMPILCSFNPNSLLSGVFASQTITVKFHQHDCSMGRLQMLQNGNKCHENHSVPVFRIRTSSWFWSVFGWVKSGDAQLNSWLCNYQAEACQNNWTTVRVGKSAEEEQAARERGGTGESEKGLKIEREAKVHPGVNKVSAQTQCSRILQTRRWALDSLWITAHFQTHPTRLELHYDITVD